MANLGNLIKLFADILIGKIERFIKKIYRIGWLSGGIGKKIFRL
jgi:hypothetical protein